MCALVLGAVRGVAETFPTILEVTNVRLLTGVRSNVNLKILLAREGLVAAGKGATVWLLATVNANVVDQLVAGVEGFVLPRTIHPAAHVVVLTVALRIDVTILDVQHLDKVVMDINRLLWTRITLTS